MALAGIGAAASIQALLGGVLALVKQILRARDDVNTKYQKLQALVKEVEELKPVVDMINADPPDEEFLRAFLQELGVELERAWEKVDGIIKDLKQEKLPPAVQTIIAMFKQGAAIQQKKIKAISETIESLRKKLHERLTARTYQTGESTHVMVKQVQEVTESTQSTFHEVRTDIKTLLQKTVTVVPQSIIPVPPPSIIASLDKWAADCYGHKTCSIDLFIQKDNEFVHQQHGYQRQTGNDDNNAGDEIKRGAREGGWEVKNSTKVQFEIKADEECNFYVLSFDKGLTFATDLDLFFPKHKIDDNDISRKRKFPDNNWYDRDPQSCKVVKHESLKEGMEGQVLFYVVLMEVKPEELASLDTKHIIEKLTSKDVDEDFFYVKRFLFDVK